MKRKALVGMALGLALVVVMGGMIIDTQWPNTDDGMHSIEFSPSDDVPFEETLNFALFETYGPLLIVVTLMLFGAIIGAACISREEDDDDSD